MAAWLLGCLCCVVWYVYYTGQCGGAACARAMKYNYYVCMRMLCVHGTSANWVGEATRRDQMMLWRVG